MMSSARKKLIRRVPHPNTPDCLSELLQGLPRPLQPVIDSWSKIIHNYPITYYLIATNDGTMVEQVYDPQELSGALLYRYDLSIRLLVPMNPEQDRSHCTAFLITQVSARERTDWPELSIMYHIASCCYIICVKNKYFKKKRGFFS